MQTFTIKPRDKERLVRDPKTRAPLKQRGEVKPRNTYWLRRLRDGDVIEVTTKASRKQETEQ